MLGGVDYVSGPYNVKFSAGMDKASFSVTIRGDKVFEMDETFQLAINSNTLPNRVTTTNPSEVNVTIVDNDGKLLILCII